MKKTKIVCTIGPASNNKEIIKELIKAGMNASRHNFSHGDHTSHAENMGLVKEVRKEVGKHIAIVLDTKGPEIRTGDFSEPKVELKEGKEFTIVCGDMIVGNDSTCSVTYADLYKDVKSGDKILIDDGLVGLEVQSIEGNKIHCVVTNSGVVSNHKGVNVPGVSIKLPALTEKDIADLKFGVEQEVDIVAASFIRTGEDVLAIRRTLSDFGGDDILIFSKIENREGVDNIDKIIKFSDGIMVARGDLGVEIPTEEVPLVQKMIIQKCNEAGKPVITATQMLDSMMRNPRPTRAEASDVANAIFDGSDAIMLSGETASGKYPVEAVQTMAKIAETTENSIDYDAELEFKNKKGVVSVPDAISLATCTTARQLTATAIITPTQSGATARSVSKHRPECNIIAVTPYESVARKLALNWGVYSILAEKVPTTDELIETCADKAAEEGYVNKGDLVIVAAGIPVNYIGSTNMLKVHIIGDILVQGRGIGDKCAYGMARIVNNASEAEDIIKPGNILVAKNIDESYMNVIKFVSGVVVSEDIASNVVLACEELDKAVIYKASDALSMIRTGSFITMDSDRGLVYSGKTTIK